MARASKEINTNSRIVIVGAAAGGLACAVALHRNGFSNVSVVESAVSPDELEHAAPINLGANAVRAFKYLGLMDQLLERSWRWAGALLQNKKGKRLGYMDAEEILQRSGFSPITTTRRQMLSVLRSGVPEAWLRYGTEVTSVSEGEGCLTICLQGGGTEEADLVVGANGFYSELREQVMGKTEVRKDGKVSVQALIPAEDAVGVLNFAQDNVFTEIITSRGSIGFGRNTDEDFNVFFNIIEDEVKEALDGESLVRYAKENFSGLDQRIDDILKVISPQNIRVYFPKDRPLSKGWSKGRIVLIGDAAHPCFQYTGLGAAMAIESALVLAHCLKSNKNYQNAFRQFEKVRLPRVKVVNAKSYQAGKMFGMSSPIGSAIRDVVVGLVPAKLAAGPVADIHVKDFMP